MNLAFDLLGAAAAIMVCVLTVVVLFRLLSGDSESAEIIRYTADVVCVRGDGEVLLIQRGWPPYKGAWALPGGHVGPGESARSAGARELWEETGVGVDPEDLIEVGVYDDPDRDPRGRYVTVAYAVRVPADTTARAGDDAKATRWARLGDDLAFDHAVIARDALHTLRTHSQSGMRGTTAG